MKNTLTNNKAGFSLVELMVVVAIIGILASIAVPNFQRFQSKARQAEAKTQLGGIYTAQKTFFGEYTLFHPNHNITGFVPDGIPKQLNGCPEVSGTPAWGQRTYSVGFHGTLTVALDAANPGFPPGSAAYCGGSGTAAANGLSFFGQVHNSTVPTGYAIGDVENAAPASFVAAGFGDIGGSARDVWTINENKLLVNTTSGL